jgi:acyl-CoA carboxylase subunit beta
MPPYRRAGRRTPARPRTAFFETDNRSGIEAVKEIAEVARRRRADGGVVVAASTLTEVLRGEPRDARAHRVLGRITVVDIEKRYGQAAGELLGRTGMSGHRCALDALVAVVALAQPRPVVLLTSDVDDLTRLTDEPGRPGSNGSRWPASEHPGPRGRPPRSQATAPGGIRHRANIVRHVNVLTSALDTSGAEYASRRAAMLARLAELDTEHAKAVAGGGPKYTKRHHSRGKLTARERIELLIDPDSPFLELSPLAAWGTGFHVGGSVVTGIGIVEGTECVLSASDPTVRGGSSNPWTLRKSLRAGEIALRNRLPLINLVESGGADLPTQKEIFIPGGQIFRDLTRLSAAGIPTIALVFGNSTAGGAYVPGMSDYVVMVEGRAKVFLGGPPLVKMATGEESDDESLGGGRMHARSSGLADYLAADEHDALRIGRSIVARLNWRKLGQPPARPPARPACGEDELLGIVPEDLKAPFDPREVIARITDGSEFDEFKPLYGTSLVTGWAALHGYPIGILANARGVLFSAESQKAAQFIQLANQTGTPLLFLQNTTGYMVGASYEQAGIIKHGALMINAVSNSRVPHLTVILGASYGAGNYGMCGRAYDPRFLFSWPSAKSAVMGPAQLAGVLSIVGRQAAAARGEPYDEAADAAMRAAVTEQIEAESQAFFLSGRIYDDGVIDPRDTRTVLGICLSAIQSAPPGWAEPSWTVPAGTAGGTSGYGVFRL